MPSDETLRMIGDLDARIMRQQKRIDKVLFNREGPVEDMQVLLDDLLKARDLMRAQLEASAKDD